MVNSPLPESLDKECIKAAKTLKSFRMPDAKDGIDSIIPPDIINNCKGLVIMTVIKAGFLFSGRIGFGLVVSKLPDGSWSAPSAIGTGSFGAGLQIGAELTDFVIILNNQRAVEAFTVGGNVALGGNLSVAAGPIGRNAEASGMATLAAVFSYSKTKGVFAGISLEGTVFVERKDENAKFYGPGVTAKQILSGSIPPPAEAEPLYDALRLRTHHSDASSSDAKRASHPPPPVPTAARPHLPPRPNSQPTGRALFDFTGQQAGDLSFKKGDIITIVEKTPSTNDWWKGTLHGVTGAFPANYVQLL